MEKLIELYFLNVKFRYIIVSHFLYLLFCLLIANKISCNWLNMCYSFPNKIDIAMILSFTLSGQIIFPLFIFITTVVIFHFFKDISLHFWYFFRIKKKKKFSEAKEFVVYIAEKSNWFHKKDGKYIKGNKYAIFKSLLKDFTDENFSVIDFANVINTLILSLTVTIVWYNKFFPATIIITVMLIFFYFFHTYNLLFLKSLQEEKDYFIEIEKQIDKI